MWMWMHVCVCVCVQVYNINICCNENNKIKYIVEKVIKFLRMNYEHIFLHYSQVLLILHTFFSLVHFWWEIDFNHHCAQICRICNNIDIFSYVCMYKVHSIIIIIINLLVFIMCIELFLIRIHIAHFTFLLRINIIKIFEYIYISTYVYIIYIKWN